jgi:periplasmic protein TonB
VKLPGHFIAAKSDPQNPPLVYPPISIRLNEQGSVLITGQILKDGTVRDPSVLRSSGSARLDESALASVRGWMFRPATLDSQPVDTYWRMALTFKLRDAGSGE